MFKNSPEFYDRNKIRKTKINVIQEGKRKVKLLCS